MCRSDFHFWWFRANVCPTGLKCYRLSLSIKTGPSDGGENLNYQLLLVLSLLVSHMRVWSIVFVCWFNSAALAVIILSLFQAYYGNSRRIRLLNLSWFGVSKWNSSPTQLELAHHFTVAFPFQFSLVLILSICEPKLFSFSRINWMGSASCCVWEILWSWATLMGLWLFPYDCSSGQGWMHLCGWPATA